MNATPPLPTDDAPVWARPEAFPEAKSGWGWADSKGALHPVGSLNQLAEAIRSDTAASVDLVWTPNHPRMVVPEEVPELFYPLFTARRRWTASDLQYATGQLKLFGIGVLAMAALAIWKNQPLLKSPALGIALVLFIIFALVPWYQAWKWSRVLKDWNPEKMQSTVPGLRFETWLNLQKAPLTRAMLVLISLVGLMQLLHPDSIRAAGLVKRAYLSGGETWRLLTAPFLHGMLPHWLMNMGALIYLGRRVEVFARWPHLPLVFMFSAIIGGEASVRFVPADSVGASGGLMGLLGFLLVFETLHSRLVPRSSRRRLLAGVVLTALIGLIGYRFIDNAAHAGGLLAGMVYAAIVFPKSSSTHRPQSTMTDRIAGILAITLMVGSAVLAMIKIAGLDR